MKSEYKSIIQKEFIELEFNNSTESIGIQESASQWCSEKLIPKFGEWIDKNILTESTICLDKVHLKLETENMDLDDNLAEKIITEFRNVLNEKLNFDINNLTKANIISKAGSGLIVERNKKFFDALIFFLRNGYLPWWSGIETKEQFTEEFSKFISAEINSDIRKTFIKSAAERIVQQRLATQFSEDEFLELMKKFFPEDEKKLSQFINDIKHLTYDVSHEEKKKILILFKEVILTQIQETGQTIKLADSVKFFVQKIRDEGNFKNLESKKENLTFSDLKNEIGKTSKIKQKVLKDFIKKDLIKKEQKIFESEDLAEEIYVSNAGLVIIAPFLSTFFKKLNLAEEGNIDKKNTAVLLVHYIATGKTNAAEFELVLPKVLCGIEIKSTLDFSDIILKEEQKLECTELLKSVIEYWNILKNTSAEGLRESFLQRKGKLSFRKTEWLLQIEQQQYDMLLQHLPWSISMIKLPWMKHIIRTEWIF